MVESVLLIFLVFLCCPIMCLYVLNSCCDVRYDFRTITMFGSYFFSVVCRRMHVLLTLFIFVYVWWGPTHIVLSLCFVCLRRVYPMLPVIRGCPLLIEPSVFSNVYLSTVKY